MVADVLATQGARASANYDIYYVEPNWFSPRMLRVNKRPVNIWNNRKAQK